jgi:hypothetical protein
MSAWTQAWFVFSISEGVAASDVAVAGTECRPLVSALALGALAAIAAVLLAGPVARIAIFSATVLIGASGLVAVTSAIADPAVAALSSLSTVMGVIDISAVAQVVTGTSITPWPWVAALGFALLALSSILGIISTRHWNRPTDRFNRPEMDMKSPRVHTTEIADGDSWDSLSRGEDPTR